MYNLAHYRIFALSVSLAGGGGGEPEAKSISESDGVTEESSNSSSLPWNVSSRQDNEVGSEDGRGGADSRQSETLPSTIQQDLQDSSNDHNSAQPTQNNKVSYLYFSCQYFMCYVMQCSVSGVTCPY